MNEMVDTFLTLLGFALSVIFPIGIIAAIMDWKTSKYENISEFDYNRMQSNLEILEILKKYAEDNPSQRLGQILRNTGVLSTVSVENVQKPEWEAPDLYFSYGIIHEEPGLTLARVEKTLAKD